MEVEGEEFEVGRGGETDGGKDGGTCGWMKGEGQRVRRREVWRGEIEGMSKIYRKCDE